LGELGLKQFVGPGKAYRFLSLSGAHGTSKSFEYRRQERHQQSRSIAIVAGIHVAVIMA
jgi:hypothetical protein